MEAGFVVQPTDRVKDGIDRRYIRSINNLALSKKEPKSQDFFCNSYSDIFGGKIRLQVTSEGKFAFCKECGNTIPIEELTKLKAEIERKKEKLPYSAHNDQVREADRRELRRIKEYFGNTK